jgi:hypothetical protein
VLYACEKADSLTLSSVFEDVGVYEVDDIRSDSSAEDSGENDVASGYLNGVFVGNQVGL